MSGHSVSESVSQSELADMTEVTLVSDEDFTDEDGDEDEDDEDDEDEDYEDDEDD